MSWTHLEDRTPKARKVYRCLLCELPIAIGERHVKRCGISEGGHYNFRMHTACEKITADQLWDEVDWECLDASSFREMLARSKDQMESEVKS